jgi:hypothetical protein
MAAIKTMRNQEVTVYYEVLPEIFGSPDDEYEYIPEQIDIKEVWLELKNLKTGKIRRINITDTVTVDDILKFEDDVTSHRAEIKRQFLNRTMHAKFGG